MIARRGLRLAGEIVASIALAALGCSPAAPLAVSPTPTAPPAGPDGGSTTVVISPEPKPVSTPAEGTRVVVSPLTPPSPVGAPPKLKTSSSTYCPFPMQAAMEGKIDHTEVNVLIDVNLGGIPTKVIILSDPGHAFGRAAYGCALGLRFEPAKDAAGVAIDSLRPVSVKIRFLRAPQRGAL